MDVIFAASFVVHARPKPQRKAFRARSELFQTTAAALRKVRANGTLMPKKIRHRTQSRRFWRKRFFSSLLVSHLDNTFVKIFSYPAQSRALPTTTAAAICNFFVHAAVRQNFGISGRGPGHEGTKH